MFLKQKEIGLNCWSIWEKWIKLLMHLLVFSIPWRKLAAFSKQVLSADIVGAVNDKEFRIAYHRVGQWLWFKNSDIYIDLPDQTNHSSPMLCVDGYPNQDASFTTEFIWKILMEINTSWCYLFLFVRSALNPTRSNGTKQAIGYSCKVQFKDHAIITARS